MTSRPVRRPPRRGSLPRRSVLGLGAFGVLSLAACADPEPGASAGGATSAAPGSASSTSGAAGWRMPDEGERHTRTWMALGATEEIWGADLVDAVWEDLAAVAAAISRFEPVSMLVRPDEMDLARELLDPAVELVALDIDDLWIRDTGPVFVTDGAQLAGVDFNFNGWGEKQEYAADALVAAAVLAETATRRLTTELVLEGGALEVDGRGTAIITKSCVLNDNRNPGWSAGDVEAELSRLLGIRKVIWLPGIAGKDITDGHTDFYARFVEPGVIVAALDEDPESYDHEVTKEHLAILEAATDVDGKPLQVHTLTAPYDIRATDAGADFAAGYVNFYVCNGGVIAPQFGDKAADAAAAKTLREVFPDREVVQVAIDAIAAGGGGIHCATQQQPALEG
ncbi:agmatine deiminase family protein [Nostocoides sp.]|uniref:agmatine deiminase family protein n=1 Tax=Nostocoides sp. TaxID=1917966 RepID=UPI002CE6A037|nr:agmatine deiminase family protein [Tetrasphaera sp.]